MLLCRVDPRAGALGGAIAKTPAADAVEKGLVNLTGIGSNGGVAHVGSTQLTKLTNGTTSSVSSGTLGKILTTEAVKDTDNIAVGLASGSAASSIGDQAPEASMRCALGAAGCGG